MSSSPASHKARTRFLVFLAMLGCFSIITGWPDRPDHILSPRLPAAEQNSPSTSNPPSTPTRQPLDIRTGPRTDHYAIVYRGGDVKEIDPNGLVTQRQLDAISNKCLEWAEAARRKIVVDLGFKDPNRFVPPGAARGEPGGQGTVIDIGRGVLGRANSLGAVSAQDNNIRLELSVLAANFGTDPQKMLLLESGVAHEVFHTAQNAHDPREETWLTESTAHWLQNRLYPGWNGNAMNRWANAPGYGLHYVKRDKNDVFVPDQGHPYGSALFFHFLVRHHGIDIVKQVFQECERVPGPNGMSAVISSLGGEEQFRRDFDRFVVGCVLASKAPENSSHGMRVNRFRSHNAGDWRKHFTVQFVDLGTSIYTVPFDESNRTKAGWLHPFGIRCFHVVTPKGIAKGSEARVAIKAARDEISVQAFTTRNDNWDIFSGSPYVSYDEAAKAYLVRIPRYEESYYTNLGAEYQLPLAQIAIARYGAAGDSRRFQTLDQKTYPMTVAVARPPVLKRLRVKQNGKAVYSAQWSDKLDDAGLLLQRDHEVDVTKQLHADNGDAEIRLEFSLPVRTVGTQPLSALDGKPLTLSAEEDGRVWVGQIKKELLVNSKSQHELRIRCEAPQGGSRAVLPLDEDPLTLALTRFNDWNGYEHDRGMVISLAPIISPDDKLELFVVHKHMPVLENLLQQKQQNAVDRPSPSRLPNLAPYLRYVDWTEVDRERGKRRAAGLPADDLNPYFLGGHYMKSYLMQLECRGETRYQYWKYTPRSDKTKYGSDIYWGLDNGRHPVQVTIYSSEGLTKEFQYTLLVQATPPDAKAVALLKLDREKVGQGRQRYAAAQSQSNKVRAARSLAERSLKFAELLRRQKQGTAQEITSLLQECLQLQSVLPDDQCTFRRRGEAYQFVRLCYLVGDQKSLRMAEDVVNLYKKKGTDKGDQKKNTLSKMYHDLAHLAISARADVNLARQYLRRSIDLKDFNRPSAGTKERALSLLPTLDEATWPSIPRKNTKPASRANP